MYAHSAIFLIGLERPLTRTLAVVKSGRWPVVVSFAETAVGGIKTGNLVLRVSLSLE